ncbi:hypothetical protein ACIBVL_38045 [Streptomyces sp. NPDC049687]|uniref:hypothetical protein n=1 Tax=Streptomyces sp. NPDC049687 TaxID=3365596 RepID=UPI0037A51C4A
MRRTTRSTTLVLALAVPALVLAGCGTESDDAAPKSPASRSPSSSTTPATDCTASAPAELTAADSGRTLCVAVGGQLRLTLDGTQQRPWSTVATTGDSLKPTNAGAVVLPGDAVAAYDAVAAGTARLTATRPLCAVPTDSDQMSCKGIREWSVTVKVTRG